MIAQTISASCTARPQLRVQLRSASKVATPAPAVRARAAVRVCAEEKKEQVYIGQGRWVEDDPKKYAGRDNMFVGGWPGGEKQLKEVFIQEMDNATSKMVEETKEENELPPEVQGKDTIYVGAGKFIKGNAKMFAGRDNWFTGGWAGGELGLKVEEERKAFEKGDIVQLKSEGGFLQGFFSKSEGSMKGIVDSVQVNNNGKVECVVKVMPWDKKEVFTADQLEKAQA